jgi:hypothetical protein
MMQPEEETREDWERDLHPNEFAGRNAGPRDAQAEKDAPTARDLKEVDSALSWLNDDALRRIPVLPTGARLKQGATYIDLKARDRREFTATAGMEAGADNWYVPKSEVDYQLWNRLIGVENPERLGRADEV